MGGRLVDLCIIAAVSVWLDNHDLTLYRAVKANENDAMRQAGVSQQILTIVGCTFRPLFNLLKKVKHGGYRFHDVRIPN